MYKVCLIQNQSEMVHYRFADLRTFLEKNNFSYDLYTAENINTLLLNFKDANYDVVIFSTNSLSDHVIYDAINTVAFKELLDEHLLQNKGVLLTSQLNYAKKRQDLNFLPIEENSILLNTDTSKNDKKSIKFSTYAKNNLLFNFPHQIKDINIQDQALSSLDIKGLYWHTFKPDMEYWDVLLEDGNDALYTIYKNKKIIATSLLLDWQNHETFLLNTLLFLMRKTLPIAFVYENNVSSDIHQYILRYLNVSQFEVVDYCLPNDINTLKQNLSMQVHQIILFANEYTIEDLYLHDSSLKELIVNNDVRSITLNYEKESFVLFGTSNSLYDTGLALELYIKNELSHGYIEGSFWKTIEVLQSLKVINPTFNDIYQNFDSINDQLIKSKANISYNDTFQATCALLWYYSEILKDQTKANNTLNWLNLRVENLNDHDYLFLAYYKHLSNIKDVDITILKEKFLSLLASNPKDLDLSILLHVSYHYNLGDTFINKVLSLLTTSYNNGWLNLFNTTNIANILAKLFFDKKLDETLRNILFDTIISLRRYIASSEIKKGKFEIVSLIKAIETCSEFEDSINFPTFELFKLIEPKNELAIVKKSDLMNDEEMRIKFYQMKSENEINKQKLKQLRYHNNLIAILTYISFMALYCIVFTVGYLVTQKQVNTFYLFIRSTWGYHVSIIPIGFGSIKFIITMFKKLYSKQP